jgi:hypothetical protein
MIMPLEAIGALPVGQSFGMKRRILQDISQAITHVAPFSLST